jgi:hypothetical protein
MLNAQGMPTEAMLELEKARELLEKLAQANPDAPEFPHRLAGVHFDLCVLQGGAKLWLLTQKEVQEDLQICPQQAHQVARLAERLAAQRREVVHGFHELPRLEQREKFKRVVADNQRALADILRPEQARRLDQVFLQLQGPLVFSNPEVADILQLTSRQKERVADIQDDILAELPPHRNCLALTTPEAERLQTDARERILKQLTAEQRAAWQGLTGAPYHGPLLAPLLRPSVALRLGMR